MKKFGFYFTLCIITICIVPPNLIAKTGYVSDVLLLTFREGPATTYPVMKTLRSSTPVGILEEQDGFYKVELQSKEIGWVDKKFIIFTTPKAMIIKQLELDKSSLDNKIEKLQMDFQSLKNQLTSSTDENIKKIQSLETSLATTANENKNLTQALSESNKKYDTLVQQSKSIQKIVAENKALKKENITLATDLESVTLNNRTLLKTGMIKWFLAGVGTLLLGWIFGRSISSRRRSGVSLLS